MLSCAVKRPPSEPSGAAPRAKSCSLHGYKLGASNKDFFGIHVSKKRKRKHVLIKETVPRHQAWSTLGKELGACSDDVSNKQALNSKSETEVRNGNMLSDRIRTNSSSTGVGQAQRRRSEANHPGMHYGQ